tara:strand:+ start:11955 stop:12803 length:849 start_codon:yes stop_codon:yes gene_type:complete
MDLELLRTFLEVNRHRHFGRAGEALHLTQSAISARIRSLEQQLGVKLFIRQYHDLQLTPEGSRLVGRADMMLSRWRKARQEVALGGAQQQLTMGGSLRLWDVVLQDWFHILRRQKPQLAIIAEMHTPDLLTKRLLDGHLDIAFMSEPSQLETLQVREVAQIELVMVSAEEGQAAEEALAAGYIMVDWGLAHVLQHRRLYPDAPEPQLRVAQARMALTHMLELGGAAYLPARMVDNALHERRLFSVSGAESIMRPAYAVYPLRSGKLELLEQIISYFEYPVTA